MGRTATVLGVLVAMAGVLVVVVMPVVLAAMVVVLVVVGLPVVLAAMVVVAAGRE